MFTRLLLLLTNYAFGFGIVFVIVLFLDDFLNWLFTCMFVGWLRCLMCWCYKLLVYLLVVWLDVDCDFLGLFCILLDIGYLVFTSFEWWFVLLGICGILDFYFCLVFCVFGDDILVLQLVVWWMVVCFDLPDCVVL